MNAQPLCFYIAYGPCERFGHAASRQASGYLQFQYCIIEFLRAQKLERPSISSECANKSCLPRSVCPVCIASQRAARKLCMVCLALLRTSHDQFHCTVSRHAHQLSSNIASKDMRTPGVEPGLQAWEACMMPLHYVRCVDVGCSHNWSIFC